MCITCIWVQLWSDLKVIYIELISASHIAALYLSLCQMILLILKVKTNWKYWLHVGKQDNRRPWVTLSRIKVQCHAIPETDLTEKPDKVDIP